MMFYIVLVILTGFSVSVNAVQFSYTYYPSNDVLVVPYYFGEWDEWYDYVVCSDDWNEAYSDQVCTELGFGSVARVDHVNESLVAEAAWGYYTVDTSAIITYGIEDILYYTTTCNSATVVTIRCTYDEVCGQKGREPVSGPSARIISGEYSDDGDYPWVAAILRDDENSTYLGVGTLLSQQWVLTSASLYADDQMPSSYKVLLGATFIYGAGSYSPNTMQIRSVAEIIIHERFNNYTNENDIALLRLDSPVNFTYFVRPVCLPDVNEMVPASTNCYTAGWGSVGQYYYFLTTFLREAPTPIHTDDDCAANALIDSDNHTFIGDSMICAGDSTGDPGMCTGDEGAPLMCQSNRNQWILAGVASWNPFDHDWGYDCATYGVYTQVTSFIDWISNKTDDSSITYQESDGFVTAPVITTPEPTTAGPTTAEPTYYNNAVQFSYTTYPSNDVLMVLYHYWLWDQWYEYPVCSDDWNETYSEQVCTELGFGSVAQEDHVNDSHVAQAVWGYYTVDTSANITSGINDILSYTTSCNSSTVVTIRCTYDEVCGQKGREPVSEPSARIISGDDSDDGDYPWVAAILLDDENSTYLGVGTLLSQQWVLTSASLYADDLMPSNYNVLLGATFIYDAGSYSPNTMQIRSVAEIIIHERFNNYTNENDIALLRLDTPVDYTYFVRPVCLPDVNETVPVRSNCYTAGWGSIGQYYYFLTTFLKEALTPIRSDDDCANNTLIDSDNHTFIGDSMICAGDSFGDPGMCTGDEGAPLMCQSNRNQWILAGVASWNPVDHYWGNDCATYGVYTQVTSFIDWISNKTDDSSITYQESDGFVTAPVITTPEPTTTEPTSTEEPIYYNNAVYLDYERVADYDILTLTDSNGLPAPVCSTDWNETLSQLVCEQLGFGYVVSNSTLPAGDVSTTAYGYYIISGSQVSTGIQDILTSSNSCISSEVVSIKCSYDECGKKGDQATTPPNIARIIQGEFANDGEYPWQAALFESNTFFCGGSVISEDYIVTAAHCVDGTTLSNLWIQVGVRNLYTDWDTVQYSYAESWIMHENYSETLLVNDIAVVKLATSLNFTYFVRPICLPPANQTFPHDTNCYTSGWGRTSQYYNIYPNNLHHAATPIVDDTICASHDDVGNYLDESTMICAGGYGGSPGICSGDSGGPLVCQNSDDRWILAGAVSWNIEYWYQSCASYSVYAEVAAFIPWIDENTDGTDFQTVESPNGFPTVAPVTEGTTSTTVDSSTTSWYWWYGSSSTWSYTTTWSSTGSTDATTGSTDFPTDYSECGMRSIWHESARIADGEGVSTGQFPWTVTVLRSDDGAQFIGTLVHANWVVVAAHNILGYPHSSSYTVVLGVSSSSDVHAGNGQTASIAGIHVHDNFDENTKQNDIALLELLSAVTFTEYVRPACLPFADEVVPDTSMCYITGWGNTSLSTVDVSTTMQHGEVNVLNDTACTQDPMVMRSNNNFFSSSQMCVLSEDGEPRTCQYDESALVCMDNDGKWVLSGAFSWGSASDSSSYCNDMAIFSEVASFVTWMTGHEEHLPVGKSQRFSHSSACLHRVDLMMLVGIMIMISHMFY